MDKLSDEIIRAIEAGARNSYAKLHHTNGPYFLKEYASKEIMKSQFEMARYVVEGFLDYRGIEQLYSQTNQ